MNINAALRNWHIKIGVFIAVPIVLSGVTAVMMAHNKDLGLRNIPVNMAWLPAYQEKGASSSAKDLEIRAMLTTRDGRQLLGTRYGLYELQDNALTRVEALPAKEVRTIVESPDGLLCAGRGGVWRYNGKSWQRIYKGDANTVEGRANHVVRIVTREKGFLESADRGQHWNTVAALNHLPVQLPSGLQQEELNLGRFALDLHTGRAFLGKDWAWLWIDLSGVGLALLAFSGVFLWSRRRKPAVKIRTDLKPRPLSQASSL